MHNTAPTPPQPADDEARDPGLEAFEAARREAAANGIAQDGPLCEKTAEIIRSRAGIPTPQAADRRAARNGK